MAPSSASPAVAAYWALVVTPGDEAHETVEAVTNFLWDAGALGVVEEATATGSTLRAFFPPGVDASALAAQARRYLAELAALGLPGASAPVAVEPLAAEPWADAWRAHFRPIPVGRRLLVCPPWEAPDGAPVAGRVVVWIEPGRAFGTGSHGSTRACLELLERVIEAGPVPRCLDVGSGSGILAIAAARLGVPRVEAVDLDPDAVAATEANAARNGVAGRVVAAVGTLETWTAAPAPLVMANLLGRAHIAQAPRLTGLVLPGGGLVAGGILVHEVPAVTAAFVPAGAWLAEVAEHDGWAALLLRRGSERRWT